MLTVSAEYWTGSVPRSYQVLTHQKYNSRLLDVVDIDNGDDDGDNDDDDDDDDNDDDVAEDNAEHDQEQAEAVQEEFASLLRPGVGRCLDRVQNASDDSFFSVVCFSTGIELHPGQVRQCAVSAML